MEFFKDLGINEEILQAIKKQGFEKPTKVQRQTIPLSLQGKDLLVCSHTGSGKTLAYAVSVITKIISGNGVQAIILTPTRELAKQVSDELKKYCEYKPLNIVTIFGGAGVSKQADEISKADIIVGTPGRISHYLVTKELSLEKIKIFILDEVDLMIKNEFLEYVDYISRFCPKTRQNMFFSATIPIEVSKLSQKYMKNPVKVDISKGKIPNTIEFNYYEVEKNDKLALLKHLLLTQSAGLSLIFANRVQTAEFIYKNIKIKGLNIALVHGNQTQGKRNQVLKNFREGKIDILITTDISARGLDVDDISNIYNYSLPQFVDKYVHRVGRTGRAGKKGKVFDLISENDLIRFLQILQEQKINSIQRPLPEFEKIEIKFNEKKTEERKHKRK